MYDCAIIGTGIAGISAALTLKALKREFILIGSSRLSEKVRKAEEIRNYPGLPAVSGEEFVSALSGQLQAEGITVTEGKVNAVYPAGNHFGIACGRDFYEVKTLILATGVEAIKPIKGEREFLGKGVSYCAVCDGFLYKGKTIAAVVTSAEEEEEVKLLAGYASQVYMFASYKGAVAPAENVRLTVGLPTEIYGEERVAGVVAGGKKIEADGVFMLKSSTAGDVLVHGLKTENGAVIVDRACRTNVAGVFAAGDCTGRPYQYAKAAGEGNVCAYSVNAYLNGK